jgi:adenylate cyclase
MNEKFFAVSCLVCGTVLEGPVGKLMNLFGIERSSQNPNLCSRCGTHLEEGRIVELTVFFADLVGFTAMTNEVGPEKSYEIVEGFFRNANQVLVQHDAFIDKYIGDAVMAIFNAPIQNTNHAQKALAAALELQASLIPLRQQFNRDIQVRIGVATGFARVGRIGSRDRKDYTAIGDVVNLASRLEAQAHPGEVLMDGAGYDQVAGTIPNLSAEFLLVKGFKDPVRAHRINPAATPSDQIRQLDPMSDAARRQVVSLGSILFAILGAPCAATAILGPLSVLLGAGALLGAAAPVFHALDQPLVRWPLQIFALLGALINLYIIWRGYRARRQSGEQAIPLTRYERSKVVFVGALASITILMIGFELYSHVFLMGNSLF